MLSTARPGLRAMAAGLSLVLAGCATHENYGGASTPPGALAVVDGYWHYRFLYDEELHIASVDGRREGGRSGWPYPRSVSLPEGKHWLQVMILRFSKDITACAFEWEFKGGHRYKLERLRHEQGLLAHPTAPRFPATIAMSITSVAGTSQQVSVPAVCGRGPLCRQDADCGTNQACTLDAGAEFGMCRPSIP